MSKSFEFSQLKTNIQLSTEVGSDQRHCLK